MLHKCIIIGEKNNKRGIKKSQDQKTLHKKPTEKKFTAVQKKHFHLLTIDLVKNI